MSAGVTTVDLKPLGKTGEKIPEIGLGTWNYGNDTAPLEAGIKLGARFIDTAEGYGTEEVSGLAAERFAAGRSGGRVVMATKVSGRHLGYDDVLRAAEESVRKLGATVIDLYQIHWPNSAFPVAETMRAMQRLIDEKTVRFAGVSNFSVREFEEAQSFMPHAPIVSNQVRYSLADREIERDLLPFCEKNGVTVIAYTPLASGRLCKAGGVLGEVAREAGKTPAQVALNWCLVRENVVVIPKSNGVGRTEENCGASGWRLTAEQVKRLNGAFPL